MDDEDASAVGEVEATSTIEFLPPNHPSLAPLQQAFLTRLERKDIEANARKLENEENVRRLERYLEDIGASLYDRQHRLAAQHESLEQLSSKTTWAEQETAALDKEVKQCLDVFEEQKRTVTDLESSLAKSRTEQSQAALSLQQLEAFHKKMTAEIALNRRITYKGEAAIRELEKTKLSQDLLVDELSEQVLLASEAESNLFTSLSAQIAERDRADAAVRTANEALSELAAERRLIKQQMQPTFIALRKRDEAVQAVLDSIKTTAQRTAALAADERSYRVQIASEQEKNESSTTILNRNAAETFRLEEEQRIATAKREALVEQFAILKKSEQATSDESARLDVEIAEEHATQALSDDKFQQLTHAIGIVANAILDMLSEKTSIDRETKLTLKAVKQVSATIESREVETNQLSNEEARVRLDTMNVKSHNLALRTKLAKDKSLLEESEAMNDKAELESRRVNAVIKKKQTAVEKLTRDLNALRDRLSTQEDPSVAQGSIEGKVLLLKRTIEKIIAETSDLQGEWTLGRAEFIGIGRSLEKAEKISHEHKLRKVVLEGRLKRLASSITTLKKDIHGIERDSKQLKLEFDKIQLLKLKYDTARAKFSEQTESVEADFATRLVSRRDEVSSLKTQIDEAATELKSLASQIVATEQSSLQVDKDIKLESELLESIDPKTGHSEAAELEKTISSMEQRLAQLHRKQLEITRSLELCVYKRDSIEIKYEPKGTSRTPILSSESANKRQIEIITRRQNQLKTSCLDIEAKRLILLDKQEVSKRRLANLEQQSSSLEAMISDYGLVLEAQRVSALRYASLAAAQQLSGSSEEAEAQVNRLHAQLGRVIEAAQARFPRYLAAWQELGSWISDALALRN